MICSFSYRRRWWGSIMTLSSCTTTTATKSTTSCCCTYRSGDRWSGREDHLTAFISRRLRIGRRRCAHHLCQVTSHGCGCWSDDHYWHFEVCQWADLWYSSLPHLLRKKWRWRWWSRYSNGWILMMMYENKVSLASTLAHHILFHKHEELRHVRLNDIS